MTAPSYLLLNASASSIPLRDESVQCVVTSPPYWGLRQYAGEQREVWGGASMHAHEWRDLRTLETTPFCHCGAWYGAFGLEPTPQLYVDHMVAIFAELHRVLRADGTAWLNLGDSYTSGGRTQYDGASKMHAAQMGNLATRPGLADGLKTKDLVGIPWRVAFALQEAGWYLRSDIVWAKPNPMPESVTDRPTKSHEYVFLLTKSERYYYDAEAIREPAIYAGTVVKASNPDTAKNAQKGEYGATALGFTQHDTVVGDGRNARTVWTIASQPYAGSHFATFPEELPRRCILAGSKPGDVVLDPFNGSGTTGRVAILSGRSYVGLDISREYLAEQAVARIDPLAGAQMEARTAAAAGDDHQGVFAL